MTARTSAEMKESHAQWLAEQPMTLRCQLPKCRWRYTGPAAQAIEQAKAHRLEKHPDLKPRTRAQIVAEAKKKRPIAMSPAASLPEPEPELPKPKEEVVTLDAPEPEPTKRFRWETDTAIEAVKAWAATHGRPPGSKEAISGSGLPSPPAATRLFGSWGSLIKAAGFPRPVRGRKPGATIKPKEPKHEVERENATDPAGTKVDATRLATFLYLLLRDELPAGAVEYLVLEAEKAKRPKFCNAHVSAYANELAGRLLESLA